MVKVGRPQNGDNKKRRSVENTQTPDCTAQGSVLHCINRVADTLKGQGNPPLAAGLAMLNADIMDPPPHDFEHVASSANSNEPTQSTRSNGTDEFRAAIIGEKNRNRTRKV